MAAVCPEISLTVIQSHKGLFHGGRWFAREQSVGPRGQAHASPLTRLPLAHAAAPWRPAYKATRPLIPAAVGPCQQGLAGRWNTDLGKSHTDIPGQCLSQWVLTLSRSTVRADTHSSTCLP